MTIGQLLRRGLAAGAAAGCAAAFVLYFLVEPQIRHALKIEDARNARDAAAGQMSVEPELVTHNQQVAFALIFLVIIGALLGLAFAVIFAASKKRLPGTSAYAKSVSLGLLSFFAVTVFPFAKIPGNPPAVGNHDTVNQRTSIYLGSIAAGVALVIIVFAIDKALAARGLDDAVRRTLDALLLIAGATVLLFAIPNSPDSIQNDVPAALIWNFRIASLAQLATLWLAMGAAFGILVSRKERELVG